MRIHAGNRADAHARATLERPVDAEILLPRIVELDGCARLPPSRAAAPQKPPYRPQTNGKAERFIRTLIEGWAYGAIYRSSQERSRALDGWL
jgi:hypothetical protein